MLSFYRYLLVLCAGWALSGAVLAAKAPLADRHAADGVSCKECHGEDAPKKAADAALCQTCHGDITTMAHTTRKMTPNPHASPGVVCTKCHVAHKP